MRVFREDVLSPAPAAAAAWYSPTSRSPGR
jgi:hypothetical protein